MSEKAVLTLFVLVVASLILISVIFGRSEEDLYADWKERHPHAEVTFEEWREIKRAGYDDGYASGIGIGIGIGTSGSKK